MPSHATLCLVLLALLLQLVNAQSAESSASTPTQRATHNAVDNDSSLTHTDQQHPHHHYYRRAFQALRNALFALYRPQQQPHTELHDSAASTVNSSNNAQQRIAQDQSSPSTDSHTAVAYTTKSSHSSTHPSIFVSMPRAILHQLKLLLQKLHLWKREAYSKEKYGQEVRKQHAVPKDVSYLVPGPEAPKDAKLPFIPVTLETRFKNEDEDEDETENQQSNNPQMNVEQQTHSTQTQQQALNGDAAQLIQASQQQQHESQPSNSQLSMESLSQQQNDNTVTAQ